MQGIKVTELKGVARSNVLAKHFGITEEQHQAADVHYNQLKNSGELRRREIHRTHVAEVEAGVHG